MTIHHHPSDETVLAYTNGSLNTALALVVGAHADGCGTCRQTIRLAQTLGGLFLDSLSPAEMESDALARVIQRLDGPEEKTVPPAPRPSLEAKLPAFLQNQTVGRKRWLAPGIWIRPILKDREHGTRAYLIGAAAGKALPHHGHNGIELTQVLQGEFFDGSISYGVGDFLEADGGHNHRPVVGPGQECICAIASQGIPRGMAGFLMRVFT
jgi:putative transcriptional regulator